MKYKISELSRLLHIPVNTLRFLEEAGIVYPERNENNAYRIFDSRDFFRLIEYKMFQSMGLPLKQITKIVTSNSLEENLQTFQDNLCRLEQTIKYQQLQYEYLSELQRKLEYASMNQNRCWVRKEKPKYVLKYMSFGNNWMGDIEEHAGALFSWINAFPMVAYCAESSVSSVFSETAVHTMTLRVDTSAAKALELPVEAACLIPEQKQISMMTCFQPESIPTKEMIQPMLYFAEDNNLKITEDLLWRRLLPGIGKGAGHPKERYYELILPLK